MPCASGAEWGDLESESAFCLVPMQRASYPDGAGKELQRILGLDAMCLSERQDFHIPGCDRMESLLPLQGTPAAWICHQCRGRKTPFSWEVSFEIPVDEIWKDVIFGIYADKWVILSKPWVQSQGWRWKLDLQSGSRRLQGTLSLAGEGGFSWQPESTKIYIKLC